MDPLPAAPPADRSALADAHGPRVARLVRALHDLHRAREVAAVQAVVRTAARELAGSDGATFVLRDGDRCYYADEDAIAPLWKGQRFPMEICVSGWAMRNRRPAVIEDVFADPRVPVEAYRATFVRSLAMVPIRTADPVGAIGTYWARRHRASEADLAVLEALAEGTAIALARMDLGGADGRCDGPRS